MSCDGSGPEGEEKFYVLLEYALNPEAAYKCYNDCPDGTSADMQNQKCFACAENCKQCTSGEPDGCITCVDGWLLEDGVCKRSCENPGYFPNKDRTVCINQIEFPLMGPIFTYASAVVTVVVLVTKVLKKDTQFLPSMIAMLGVLEFFAIIFVMLTA